MRSVATSCPSELGHGAPHSIPAILLARLALDRSLHLVDRIIYLERSDQALRR